MAKKETSYGRCMNPECSKFGDVVPIPESGKCLECGRDLEVNASNNMGGGDYNDPYGTVEPTNGKKPTKLIILILAIIVVIGIVVAAVIGIKKHTKEKALEKAAEVAEMEKARLDSIAEAESARLLAEEQARLDSIRIQEETAMEQARKDSIDKANSKKTPKVSSGRIDYGKWTGSWKNGKPNGNGTMTYTKERLIDNRDPQKRVAKRGDYIIGEYVDGKLVQGRWYDSSNNLKGSIIIGR